MFEDRRRRRGLALPTAIAVIAGIIGTLFGKALGPLLGDGLAFDLIAGRQPYGLEPATVNLWILDVTFGFHLHFSVVGLAFAALALLVYKRT